MMRAAEQGLIPTNFEMTQAHFHSESAPVTFIISRKEPPALASARSADTLSSSRQQFDNFLIYVNDRDRDFDQLITGPERDSDPAC
jgi:hypothetical protein